MDKYVEKSLIIEDLDGKDEISVKMAVKCSCSPSEYTYMIKEIIIDILKEINFDTYKINDRRSGKLRNTDFRRFISIDRFLSSKFLIYISVNRGYYYDDKDQLWEHIVSQIYKQNRSRNIFLFSDLPSYKYIEYIDKDMMVTFIREKARKNSRKFSSILYYIFGYAPIHYIKDLLINHREIFTDVNYTDCLFMNLQIYLRDKMEFINLFNDDLIVINNKSTEPRITIFREEVLETYPFFTLIMEMSYISTHQEEYKKKFSSMINLIEQ